MTTITPMIITTEARRRRRRRWRKHQHRRGTTGLQDEGSRDVFFSKPNNAVLLITYRYIMHRRDRYIFIQKLFFSHIILFCNQKKKKKSYHNILLQCTRAHAIWSLQTAFYNIEKVNFVLCDIYIYSYR